MNNQGGIGKLIVKAVSLVMPTVAAAAIHLLVVGDGFWLFMVIFQMAFYALIGCFGISISIILLNQVGLVSGYGFSMLFDKVDHNLFPIELAIMFCVFMILNIPAIIYITVRLICQMKREINGNGQNP